MDSGTVDSVLVGRDCLLSTVSLTTISVTDGCPFVIVPVLSSTIAVNLCACSSAALFLKRIPFSAPLPTPTMIEVGVASPMAQGQAMTSTAVRRIRAGTNSPPTNHQTIKVNRANPITPGTK